MPALSLEADLGHGHVPVGMACPQKRSSRRTSRAVVSSSGS